MTSYAKLLDDALDEHVTPALASLGFVRARRQVRWTDEPLQVRPVPDSKANDPFAGSAFTLEFEVANDGHFEKKLAGRVRINQLLDSTQQATFLRVRNAVARRLPRPPEEHLALIDPSLQAEYLKPFQEAAKLESGSRFWMRFRTSADLDEWCAVVVPELPTLIERARKIPSDELLLGKSLDL